MPKRRLLSLEENILWHKIAKTTKPADPEKMSALLSAISLPQAPKPTTPKVSKPSTLAKPKPSTAIKPPSAVIADASGHKKVRRGKLDIDAVVDLHGFTQEAAQSKLTAFILDAVHNRFRCVLVISGKGSAPVHQQSGDFWISPRGIIRNRLKDWLHDPTIRKYIAGVSQANPKHGGAGAFYVLLKSVTA